MSDLERLVAEGAVRRDVVLGPMTTYKSGGPARYYVEVPDIPGLEALVGPETIGALPVLILGRGSNLVVADGGFPGLVIHLGAGFGQIAFEGAVVVAGGAVSLPRLARASVDRGLSGLEFFLGVPGSIGGAIRQNAGCFGHETRERLQNAVVFNLIDGSTRTVSSEDLKMSYRYSNIGATDVVVEAVFAAEEGDVKTSKEELRRITRWRRDHQPGGTFNAGSVFKNPPGETAGALIDRLGLKGMSVGEVAVSAKHANFFVAGPDATSAHIVQLVKAVKDRVFEATGTILEPEIQFVGFEK